MMQVYVSQYTTDYSSLRCTRCRVFHMAVWVQYSGPKPFAEKTQKGPITDPLFYQRNQVIVVDGVVVTLYIKLYHPFAPAFHQTVTKPAYRIPRAFTPPVCIAEIFEVLLEYCFEYPGRHPLCHLVRHA